MKTEVFHFKVLVKETDEGWVAQCLEMDLVAVEDTLDQVAKSICDIIYVQIAYGLENDNIEYSYRAAPIADWKSYFSSTSRTIYTFSKDPIYIDNIFIMPEFSLNLGVAHAAV
jgi:hypothetical protein